MDAPNPKRPCLVPLGTSSIENPCSLPIAPDFNQSNIDLTISSFLSLSDLPLFSLPLSIGCSFDRVLDNVIPSIAGTSRDEFDQDRFLDRTLQLASLLYKSTKRCIRKRATLQNSTSWPLLPELTIKVFSMLDTKSLMQASACCTMFNKCAMDRVCYSHIDLTTAAEDVDNGVVCVMIHRAGKELRSLKLGSISSSAEPTTSLLTRSCLTPLTFNHGFTGGLELCGKDSPLETLILRDCYILKESEVLLFLNSLLAGDFKYIRLIDVSNVDGLVCDGGNRTFEPRFPIEELKKQRSNVTFVAIFESQSSLSSSSSGEVYSDGTSSWTSNYNSAEEEHDNDLDSV